MESLKIFTRELIATWKRSRPPRLSAALAYYSLFSLVPILFIVLFIADIFLEELFSTAEFYGQLAQVLGAETAALLQSAVTSLADSSTNGSVLAALIGLATMLYAATGLFAQLKNALNTIWEVPASNTNSAWQIVSDRLVAFVLVIGAGCLFAVAVFANLVISSIAELFPLHLSLSLINNGLIFIVCTLAIALLYKILPDVRIKWRDVWAGAALAALLILVGGRLLSIYLAHSNLASAYQAAGALAVLLVGIYYLTQIFLFGVVFTRVYATTFGSLSTRSAISPANANH